jgi:hypothetical protein
MKVLCRCHKFQKKKYIVKKSSFWIISVIPKSSDKCPVKKQRRQCEDKSRGLINMTSSQGVMATRSREWIFPQSLHREFSPTE